MREAIAHREAVEAPALSATPHAFVGNSLMCESLDDTAVGRVVVDDVIRRSVGSEVVLHRLVGMTHSDVPETPVARDERCLEQKL